MTFILAALAPMLAAQAAAIPALDLEQQTSLRCATAFAIVSAVQERGGASEYPPLAERGSEFFVRTMARLMDETGTDRAGIQALVGAEAKELEDPERIEQVMPACLMLLESSGL